MKEKSIQELAINFINNKSESTFNPLYYRLKEGMYFYANNFIKDKESTEEIVSTAFAKAWAKSHLYRETYKFSTWIYRILHNEAMDHIRRTKETISTDSDYFSNGDLSGIFNEAKLLKQAVSEEFVITQIDFNDGDDFHDRILNDIDALPDKFKQIMIDRSFDDMKYEDIAKKHGIKLNAVKGRIFRGRQAITSKYKNFKKYVHREPIDKQEYVPYAEFIH